MKNLQAFSTNRLNESQVANIKGGGTINIFCEIYIGRQNYLGEAIDNAVLERLMKWDDGVNDYFANK